MKKVLIYPLGLAVDTQLQKSIDAFAKLGISKLKMLWHWSTLNKIFESFKRGDITSFEQFKAELLKVIPEVKNISDEQFIAAWNAMCEVSENTRKIFENLSIELAQNEEVEIYLLGNTNSLHIEHIQKTYGKSLPGKLFLSYEQKKLGNNLLEDLINHLHESKLSSEKIGLVYQAPTNPYPNLGLLAWFYAPFKKWSYYNAQRYVASIEKIKQGNKFKLVENNIEKIQSFLDSPSPIQSESHFSVQKKPTYRDNILFKTLYSPSLHPIKASMLAGVIATACLIHAPWLMLINTSLTVSVLMFVGLTIRNKLYDPQYQGYYKGHADAHNFGLEAADSYRDYAKSFIHLPSWRHPLMFGHAMRHSMLVKEEREERESNKRTLKRSV